MFSKENSLLKFAIHISDIFSTHRQGRIKHWAGRGPSKEEARDWLWNRLTGAQIAKTTGVAPIY